MRANGSPAPTSGPNGGAPHSLGSMIIDRLAPVEPKLVAPTRGLLTRPGRMNGPNSRGANERQIGRPQPWRPIVRLIITKTSLSARQRCWWRTPGAHYTHTHIHTQRRQQPINHADYRFGQINFGARQSLCVHGPAMGGRSACERLFYLQTRGHIVLAIDETN